MVCSFSLLFLLVSSFTSSPTSSLFILFYFILCYRFNSITIYTDLNWLTASYTHNMVLDDGGGSFFGYIYHVFVFFLIIFCSFHMNTMTVIGIKSRIFNQPYRHAYYALYVYIFIHFHFIRIYLYQDREAVLHHHHHRHHLNIQTAKSF